jgi:hypothetical protein
MNNILDKPLVMPLDFHGIYSDFMSPPNCKKANAKRAALVINTWLSHASELGKLEACKEKLEEVKEVVQTNKRMRHEEVNSLVTMGYDDTIGGHTFHANDFLCRIEIAFVKVIGSEEMNVATQLAKKKLGDLKMD